MPIYEYRCEKCGNELEVMHKVNDPSPTECPKCHEQTARRQISKGAGFILKGSGWYSDLYSSPSNKKDGAQKDEAPVLGLKDFAIAAHEKLRKGSVEL